MSGWKFKKLKVGQFKKLIITINEKMFQKYMIVSGDFSFIHVKYKVVHGFLLGSLVSQVIGMSLPGASGMLHSIRLDFRKPCYVGDTVIIICTVLQKIESLKEIILDIRIEKGGILLVTGQAMVGINE